MALRAILKDIMISGHGLTLVSRRLDMTVLPKQILLFITLLIVSTSCGPSPEQAANIGEHSALRYAIRTSGGHPERIDTGNITFRFVGNTTTANAEIVNCSTGIKLCFLFDNSVSFPLNYTSQGLTAVITSSGSNSNLSLRSNNTATTIGSSEIGIMTWYYDSSSQDRARADRRHSELLRQLRTVESQINAESQRRQDETLQTLGAVVGAIAAANNGNIPSSPTSNSSADIYWHGNPRHCHPRTGSAPQCNETHLH